MKASKLVLASALIAVAGSASAITRGESAAMCWGVHVVMSAIQNNDGQPQASNINLKKAETIIQRYQSDASFGDMKTKIIAVTNNDPQSAASLLAKSAKSACGGAGMSLPYGIPDEPLSKAAL